MSKYNSFGCLNTLTEPIIEKGDKVLYHSFIRDDKGKYNRADIQGIWDGEKVEFYDKDLHIVRTKWWLTKLS